MSNFYEGIAEIFEIDVSEVNPNLDLNESGWDSLAIVSTIALVDDCFDVLLDGQSLGECLNIAMIESLIETKKQN